MAVWEVTKIPSRYSGSSFVFFFLVLSADTNTTYSILFFVLVLIVGFLWEDRGVTSRSTSTAGGKNKSKLCFIPILLLVPFHFWSNVFLYFFFSLGLFIVSPSLSLSLSSPVSQLCR